MKEEGRTKTNKGRRKARKEGISCLGVLERPKKNSEKGSQDGKLTDRRNKVRRQGIKNRKERTTGPYNETDNYSKRRVKNQGTLELVDYRVVRRTGKFAGGEGTGGNW